MYIVNRNDILPIEDACGQLQGLYNSENLSISYSTITTDTIPHKHLITEEVYTIIKGKAQIYIGEKVFDIVAGDTIRIPKDTYHHITNIEDIIDLIVVSHPKYNPSDVIY